MNLGIFFARKDSIIKVLKNINKKYLNIAMMLLVNQKYIKMFII